MCGIAGALVAASDSQRALDDVRFILDRQRNRGPEAFGAIQLPTTGAGAIALGHNRLKITDQSEAADQPMWNANRDLCITFNGEIHNHRLLRSELESFGRVFRTDSDTEVILAAIERWGMSALDRLTGSFAFGLVDVRRQRAWLVRDRFGKCPLYYVVSSTGVYFASEARALALRFGLEPDLEYAMRGICYWVYDDESRTSPYRDVFALPAAHRMEFDLSRPISSSGFSNLVRYYDLNEAANVTRDRLKSSSFENLLEEARETLDSAIDLAALAEVPVGITLSGGLDSTAIASRIVGKGKSVSAYTFGDPNRKFTEGPLVADFSRDRGIQTKFVWPTKDELLAGLSSTIRAQGAPFTNASVIGQNLVYKRAAEDGMKVLLGGQGGDEVFMGYRKFQLFKLRDGISRRSFGDTFKSLVGVSKMLGSERVRLRDYSEHIYRYSGKRKSLPSIFDVELRSKLNLNHDRSIETLAGRQVRDITSISLPTLLRYEDRNSLGNGVEGRLPFVNHKVVELGVALDDSLKIRDGFGKWIVRKITEDRVPDAIRTVRYKSGFDISMNELLKLGLGDAIRHSLSSDRSYSWAPLKKSFDPVKRFSDANLVHNKMAFAEAITLAWLNDFKLQASVRSLGAYLSFGIMAV